MAWLQKRPQVSDPTNFYTVGLNKTVILVGLGNPGKEYDGTRHNIGFSVLDHFVSSTDGMADWISKKDLKCLLSTGQLGETRVLAVKPTTFMNLSGEALSQVINFYKLSAGQVAVVHDDLDIDFGQIRLRVGGEAAGHNGIKSIIENIGEDFGRIRVGIGPKSPPQIKAEDFVLKQFNSEEVKQIPNLLKEVQAIMTEYVYGTDLPRDTRNFLI